MDIGERRRLVFTNLANGLPVPNIMEALHLSEKEVQDDFAFVCRKLRSYRFERLLQPVPCATIIDARNHRAAHLTLLGKMKLDKDPTYSKLTELPFTVDGGGGMSDAERALADMKMRAASHGR